jgi:hypothetical protein
VDKYDALDTFIDVMKKDRNLINVLLPGYAFTAAVSKYIPAKLGSKFAVILESMRMFTGSTSGFACSDWGGKSSSTSSESGDSCDNLSRIPPAGYPIPPPVAGPSFASMTDPLCEDRTSYGSSPVRPKPDDPEKDKGDEDSKKPKNPIKDQTSKQKGRTASKSAAKQKGRSGGAKSRTRRGDTIVLNN